MKPLTPPESDLQDFPFMPLHVARLRDSDLASEEKPEACWYAVLLWAASWHQLPAGSLPDNEAVLTKLIGLGRDVRTFRRHRDAAMRGFVKCDDGRLYHPVVAEQVLAAWESKKQQRWRSECARIKKANQRHGTNTPTPTFEEFISGVSPAQPAPGPRIVPEDTADCPAGQVLQETGTGISKKEANASSVAEPSVEKSRTYPEGFEAAWRAYPHHKGRSSKPKAVEAWRRLPAGEREGLVEAIGRFVPNVASVTGGKGAQDMATWLRDGKHLNWQAEEALAPTAPTFDGPPEMRAALVAEKGEDFAVRWLDHYCRWSAGNRTLVARSPVVAKTLERELPAWLAKHSVSIATETARAQGAAA